MKTIQLTQGKVALVDDADFEAVNAHKWHAKKIGQRFYAARNIRKPDGGQVVQYLHQFLMPDVSEIDHKDGDGLNDQMHNLRPATRQQNCRGFRRKRLGASSRFRGVCWNKESQKWESQIEFDGKNIHLGLFQDEPDAARAYNEAAHKYFGDRAHLNII